MKVSTSILILTLFFFAFWVSCSSNTDTECDDPAFKEIEAAIYEGEQMMNIPNWVSKSRKRCICHNDQEACKKVEEYFQQQERTMQEEIERINRNINQ